MNIEYRILQSDTTTAESSNEKLMMNQCRLVSSTKRKFNRRAPQSFAQRYAKKLNFINSAVLRGCFAYFAFKPLIILE